MIATSHNANKPIVMPIINIYSIGGTAYALPEPLEDAGTGLGVLFTLVEG
jgi:hypothetical protein